MEPSKATHTEKRSEKHHRLLHRRAKTFHCLPKRRESEKTLKHEETSNVDLFFTRRKMRPQSCSNNNFILEDLEKDRPQSSVTSRPIHADRRLTLERKRSVSFVGVDGNSSETAQAPERHFSHDRVTSSRERFRRTGSASSIRSVGSNSGRGMDHSSRTKSGSKPSLPRVHSPGLIKFSSSFNFGDFREVDYEGDDKERKRLLLEKFRHAARLVTIFSTFCIGIKRYAEQEKSTEYDLYYLRDMLLPGNEDKPTPVQEASLYFNKHLFSRDNTLHFPFWARWTCAVDPADRTDAEISKLVSLLRGMKSFNKFSREAQWHLCRTMTYAKYEKRRIIVRQGHPGFCFYFIVSGTVSVTVKRCDLRTGIHVTTTVDVLEKNDSFGEIALMTKDARRTATIICRDQVEVLVVNRETVMEHCPDVFKKDFDEKYNVLSRQELFKHWNDTSLRELCFESHIKELAHGKLVDPDSTKSEAIYFILKGKVDMLRKLDLAAVLASRISISLYETKPLPRPSSALPGKGRPAVEFVNVGSLHKNDSWDLRPLFTEDFDEPGNILVSAGVRLLKVPKQRILQLSPMGAMEEFRKSFVLSHRSPSADELYQEYMAAQSWIEYRQKVVQNVLDCKKGYHVAHTPSLAKGTSGWGPWPKPGIKNLGHESPKSPENE